MSRPVVVPPRPAPGDVVLEASIDLSRGPVDRRLFAPSPSIFTVEVRSGGGVRALVGAALPSTPEREGGPDPAVATTLAAPGGMLAGEVRAYASGIYVLRIEATDAAARGPATVRVRRRQGS